MIRKAKKGGGAGRYMLAEVLDMIGIPDGKRKAAEARLSQYRTGRETPKRSKAGETVPYSYGPRLIEVVDYNKVGRTILYTEAGIEKARALLADISEPIE